MTHVWCFRSDWQAETSDDYRLPSSTMVGAGYDENVRDVVRRQNEMVDAGYDDSARDGRQSYNSQQSGLNNAAQRLTQTHTEYADVAADYDQSVDLRARQTELSDGRRGSAYSSVSTYKLSSYLLVLHYQHQHHCHRHHHCQINVISSLL